MARKPAQKPAPAGHNQLRTFVERIERLEEEKKSISDDVRDVYGEAKSNGFDVKVLRRLVALRKQDAAERDEQQTVLETYMHALGMLSGTPLGDAAMKRDGVTEEPRTAQP